MLHGGTGISAESLQEAIRLGVMKVNYGTYLKQKYLAAVRAAVGQESPNPHELLGMGGPRDVMVAGRHAVRDAVLERIGCLGLLWKGRMMADVGCAGILVADTFCGPMKRLPQPGELLALDEMPIKAGGCAANVAIDLAKQGICVDVCGCVGTDGSGAMLVENLRTFGVGCDEIHRLDSYPTSKTVILLVDGQDRRYLHVFGANAGFTVGRIRRSWLDGLKVFYLGGLFAMPAVLRGRIGGTAGLLPAAWNRDRC